MKTIKQNYNFFKSINQPSNVRIARIFMLFFFSFAISCTTDDDGEDTQSISIPTLNYASTTIEAEFSTSGNSSAPTLNWNGEQGSLSLVNTIPGVNINTTTGVVSWNRLLPEGTNNLQLIASNSAGQTSVNLTINNTLQGVFTGTYDSDTFFQFEFMTDGTAIVKANSETSPDLAFGTYTTNNGDVLVNYTYEGTTTPYSILGTLVQTQSGASLSGNWYFTADADPDQFGGNFELSL